jgi:hypothetical protein
VGLARVGNISDIARVSIGNCVLDGLDATVGKLDMVFTVGRVSITGFALAKVHISFVGVLGIDTISILVLGRSRLVSTLSVGSGSTTSLGEGKGDGKKGRESNEDL